MENLKSSLSAAAQGLMGSGWIWLVCDENAQRLAFIASYGPGTLLVRNRQHKHPEGLDGTGSIGGSPIMSRSSIPKILGEDIRDGINASKSKAPLPFNPLSIRPSGLRSFHHSSSSLSPLSAALLQGFNVRQPRFSQTSPAWAPLEPLSKSHSRPGVFSYSTHPLDEADEEGISQSEGDAEKELEETPLEEKDSGDRLLDAFGMKSTRKMMDMGERANTSWDKNRLRGAGDDLSPLLCIR
jgi:hypothetical protein